MWALRFNSLERDSWQGIISRYQARQGKYRIRLDDDGKELDLALPDPSIQLLPAAKTSKRTR